MAPGTRRSLALVVLALICVSRSQADPGVAPVGESRQGGETRVTAIPIPFTWSGVVSDSGNTTGAVDDFTGAVVNLLCAESGQGYDSASFAGPDHWYSFTLPQACTVQADLCAGGSWDSCLGLVDAQDRLIAIGDDHPGCSPNGQRSRLESCCLAAGTYWLVVDGSGGSQGAYGLQLAFGAASCQTDCDTYLEQVLELTAPGQVSGSTVGDPDVFFTTTGGDQGIEITIPQAGEWNFSTCFAGTDFATDLYLLDTAPGCEAGTLIALEEDPTCSSAFSSDLLDVYLEEGTYHLVVSGSAEGNFTLVVDESTRPTWGPGVNNTYTWINNFDPAGPVFDWVEISETGTLVPLANGDSYASPQWLDMIIPLFTGAFQFVYISSNGFFSTYPLTSSWPTNQNIPGGGPSSVVAPFWDDLDMVAGESAVYLLSDSLHRRCIVEWKDFRLNGESLSFEVILYQSGTIVFQYLDMPAHGRDSATAGLSFLGYSIRMNYNNTGMDFISPGGALHAGVAAHFRPSDADLAAPVIVHDPLPDSDDGGPFAITATITDEGSDISTVTLHFRVDGGAWIQTPMSNGQYGQYGSHYTGTIPGQGSAAVVEYYIEATDMAGPDITSISSTWTFHVLVTPGSPPLNLSATYDTLPGIVRLAWSPPDYGARSDHMPPPRREDFSLTHQNKAGAESAWRQALAEWLDGQRNGGRTFLGYRVFRDAAVVDTTFDLEYNDLPFDTADHSYQVTALFDSGESAPSNTAMGRSGERPTRGGGDGWTWINNLDPEGPVETWYDISNSGTLVPSPGDDSVHGPYGLGINFPWFEGTRSSVYISSNGYLGLSTGSSGDIPLCLPDDMAPHDLIAACWEDLDASLPGSFIRYRAGFISTPFVVQWHAPLFGDTEPYEYRDVEAILKPNGEVWVAIADEPIQGDHLFMTHGLTLGLQDSSGTRGVSATCDLGGGQPWNITYRFSNDHEGPVIVHTPLGDTEQTGNRSVTATISDEGSVTEATIHWRVDQGTWNTEPMVNFFFFLGFLPASQPGHYEYYIRALDDVIPANETVSPIWSFLVQDISLPPLNLSASDGVYELVNLSWSPPAWLTPLAAQGPEPDFEDYLPLHSDKDAAWAAWQADHEVWLAAQQPADRVFIEYRVYRDGALVGTTGSTSYTDIPPDTQAHSYHITAVFTAGESDPSNSDAGHMLLRPTRGGPGGANYIWVNSEDPDGEPFAWEDINATGTQIASPTDDGYTGPYPLGFNFTWFGTTYTSVYIASNGFLSFTGQSGSLSNQNLPSPTIPNAVVAGFWDDLNPQLAGSSISYLGDAGHFVVSWHAPPYGAVQPYSYYDFQVVLTPDGLARVRLLDVLENDVSQATLGIENATGTLGLTANLNGTGGRLADGRAYVFKVDQTPPQIVHVPLPDTELPGPYEVSATIHDTQGSVAAGTLKYRVNGGAYTSVAMSGAGDTWTAQIPAQPASSTVDYYLVARDTAVPANADSLAEDSFRVIDYTLPPDNFSASDGDYELVNLSWNQPSWAVPGGQGPEADRSFLEYRIYRDGAVVGTSGAPSYTDIPPDTLLHSYHVTAFFDGGESDPSNSNTGWMRHQPTRGGPDAYGYQWRNSNDAAGPTFSWLDISGVGTVISLASGDSYSTVQSLSMTFPFYGAYYSGFFASSNGFISFSTLANSYPSNSSIPNASPPGLFIAGLWDNLEITGSSRLYRFRDTPNQRTIIQYKNYLLSGQPIDFEIILHNNGNILVQFLNVPGSAYMNSATVGVEGSSTTGLQVNCNGTGGLLDDGIAILFQRPGTDTTPPVVEVAWLEDTEMPGPYPVSATITDAGSGVASATLRYRVNGGSWTSTPMSGAGSTFTADLPAQPGGTTMDYYVQAVDGAIPPNPAISDTHSFQVIDFSLPPTDLVASDSLSAMVIFDWTMPVSRTTSTGNRVVGSRLVDTPQSQGHGNKNRNNRPEMQLVRVGEAGRDFLRYRIYADSMLLGSCSSPPCYYIPDDTLYHSYQVTAQWDGGESDPSEPAIGRLMPRPTHGGPDAYSTHWVNSQDPSASAPVFTYHDLSVSGAEIGNLVDEGYYGPFPLGFDFPFYDNEYSEVYISTNGMLTFTSGASYYSYTCPPDPLGYNNTLRPFWQDLDPSSPGSFIRYGPGPGGDGFVVHWHAPYAFYGPSHGFADFQIHLDEQGDATLMVGHAVEDEYDPVVWGTSSGLENIDASIGLSARCDFEGSALSDSLAILFHTDRVGPIIQFYPPYFQEATGPFPVSAYVSDSENGVSAVSLFYRVNGGAYQELPMTGSEPDYYAEIPGQIAGSIIDCYVRAYDDAGPVNGRTSWTRTTYIVDPGLPPQDLTASDDEYERVELSWEMPDWITTAQSQTGELETIPTFDAMLSTSRESTPGGIESPGPAEPADQGAARDGERSFHYYNVYRDGQFIGISWDTNHTDSALPDTLEHSYHVTAVFDSLESTPSNTDLGHMLARPTRGGPDGFGYSWIHSDHPEGPEYEWVDILTTGTLLPPAAQATFWGPLPLGFPFSFYGGTWTEVFVSSNGFLSFGSGSSSSYNQNLPDPTLPNQLIAGFWDDLRHGVPTAPVYWLADSTNGRFVVQYAGSPHDFEIILNSDGSILVQYQYVVTFSTVDESLTSGLENGTGTQGLTAHYQDAGARVASSTAICFQLPTPCEPVTDLAVSVTGEDLTLSWSPVPGATSYQIQRSGEGYGPFTALQTTSDTSLLLPGEAAPGRYFYRVLAYCDSLSLPRDHGLDGKPRLSVDTSGSPGL